MEKHVYTYDSAGNKKVEEIWQEGKHYKREYEYFKNNTVKAMTETGDNNTVYTYHYDGAGNIDSKTVTEDGITKTYTYTYDPANRMITESVNGGDTRTYRYDANGNRIARVISATDSKEFSTGSKEVADYFYYDYNDQLDQVVEHNGHNYTYGYDGEGNRLWRTYSQYSVIKPPVDEGETTPKEGLGKVGNSNNSGNSKTNEDGDDANKGQGQEKNGNSKNNTQTDTASAVKETLYLAFW